MAHCCRIHSSGEWKNTHTPLSSHASWRNWVRTESTWRSVGETNNLKWPWRLSLCPVCSLCCRSCKDSVFFVQYPFSCFYQDVPEDICATRWQQRLWSPLNPQFGSSHNSSLWYCVWTVDGCKVLCLDLNRNSFHAVPPTGGKLRGSLGKLPKFSTALILGMCVLINGHYVHGGIWRRLCKNHSRTPFHGLLHSRWSGKITSFLVGTLPCTPTMQAPHYIYHLYPIRHPFDMPFITMINRLHFGLNLNVLSYCKCQLSLLSFTLL